MTIQVTADDEAQALKYTAEDVGTMLSQYAYALDFIDPAEDPDREAAQSPDDADYEAEVTASPHNEGAAYTCWVSARFHVEAETREEAGFKALAFPYAHVAGKSRSSASKYLQ